MYVVLAGPVEVETEDRRPPRVVRLHGHQGDQGGRAPVHLDAVEVVRTLDSLACKIINGVKEELCLVESKIAYSGRGA